MIFQNTEYNTRIHVYIEAFCNMCSNFVASMYKAILSRRLWSFAINNANLS